MVFRLKLKPNGSIDRYRARLVTRDYDEIEGINYFDTFSPMVKLATIRIVLTLVVSYDWSIR